MKKLLCSEIKFFSVEFENIQKLIIINYYLHKLQKVSKIAGSVR